MATAAKPSRRFRLLPEDTFIGWTPYMWLIYLPTLFITPAAMRSPAHVWWITGIICALFLPLYFRAYWVRGRKLLAVTAAIALLGIILAPFNNSGFALFIYAASFAGHQQPPRFALSLLVVISAIVILEAWTFSMPVWMWGWALIFVWVVGGVNTHFTTVRKSDVVLRRAREEIEHLAKVAERERIARDLHDVLGHTLSLITLKAALASRLADRDPAKAAEEIRDVERISREALGEVRAAVAGFRDAGIARESDSARAMLEAAGITPRIEIQPVAFSATEEAVLALALREGVTNVVRHSQASTCTVRVFEADGRRTMTIADDGRWKRAPYGNGLTGMRERIEALGGTLDVASDEGTTLSIALRPQESQSRQESVAKPLHVVA